MQFMLMFAEPLSWIHKQQDPKEGPGHLAAWREYIGAMVQAGVMDKGDGLKAPETATTVRLRNGKREVQDGPYCEAKEYLGGYVVVTVDHLDDAIGWAEKAPCAAYGSVEVRPVMDAPTG